MSPFTSSPRIFAATVIALLSAISLLDFAGTAQATQSGSSAAAPTKATDQLYSWGFNDHGELGDGTITGPDTCGSVNQPEPCSTSPVPISLPPGVVPTAVASGGGGTDLIGYAAYAIGSDGKLYAWGDNGLGELGDGNTNGSDTPVVVALPAGVTATAIAGGGSNGYAIGSDGNLYAWGSNLFGELGDGSDHGPDTCPGPGGGYPPPPLPCSTTPVAVSLPSGVIAEAIAAGGGNDAYAIGSDGNLYAWGNNAGGGLGDGRSVGPKTCTTGPFSVPCSKKPIVVSLPPGVHPMSIAGGYAIGSDGNLYAWGDSSVGQLGDGDTTGPDTCEFDTPCATAPVPVSLPPGVAPTAIAGGGRTAYFIGSDGNAYAWGYNGDGELGDGTIGPFTCPDVEPCSSTPVRVSLPSGVSATTIDGGNFNGYAIGSDGNLYAWGYDGGGELGNGSDLTDGLAPSVVPFSSGGRPEGVASGTSADSIYAIVMGRQPKKGRPYLETTRSVIVSTSQNEIMSSGIVRGTPITYGTSTGQATASSTPPACSSGDPGSPASGTSTVVAKDGDTIFISYAGTVCQSTASPTSDSYAFTGTFTINGGSGRFSGASGGGTLATTFTLYATPQGSQGPGLTHARGTIFLVK